MDDPVEVDVKHDTERWLPVVGHEGYYEVSDHGRVRSVEREVEKTGRWGGTITCVLRERVLSLKPTKQGYMRVSLSKEGAVRYVRVHVLVLEAFIGPCPEGEQGLHDDGDGTNNWVGNLAWGTPSQNAYDRVRHGTHHYSRRDRCGRGHRLVRVRSDSGRRCQECKR